MPPSPQQPPPEVKGKVVVVGEYSVGKTSLAQRFINKTFTGRTEPTIGAAFQVRTVQVPSGQSVKLEIWDTAGSERYRSLMPMYYRDALVAVICYDITNGRTFDRVSTWVDDFRKHNEIGGESVQLVLAGTKCDLAAEKREVAADDARAFAKQENMIFFECSAKNDENVVEVFGAVAQHIAKVRAKSQPANTREASNGKGSTKVDLRDDDASVLGFLQRRQRARQRGEEGCKC